VVKELGSSFCSNRSLCLSRRMGRASTWSHQ